MHEGRGIAVEVQELVEKKGDSSDKVQVTRSLNGSEVAALGGFLCMYAQISYMEEEL